MTFARLEQAVERLCIWVAVAGGLGLLAATVVTCVSILLKLLRRTLDAANLNIAALENVRPILGEEEIVQYGVALALFAALPYVMFAKGHITVDLFKSAFGARLNHLLDLLDACDHHEDCKTGLCTSRPR